MCMIGSRRHLGNKERVTAGQARQVCHRFRSVIMVHRGWCSTKSFGNFNKNVDKARSAQRASQ